MKPSAPATPRATVDLPAPAGPSIAITMAAVEDRAGACRWRAGTSPSCEVEPRQPEVLDSEDEGRAIVINLPAGRAARRSIRCTSAPGCWWSTARSSSTTPDGKSVSGGAGLLAVFDPKERHEVCATEDSRLLLVLSPWPGDGPPVSQQPSARVSALRSRSKPG